MKDIEKIKSEDLAAQVQDANPANFAIEQEVAQLVGATVPQPTEPSADDARELPAQLLVFLRRALTPIQTALRTAVAAIYAHLDSRCTDYTPAAYASYIPRPYDPMGSTPRTLPNLLTAITAFDSRKISNGSAQSDGIPDGTSLAHLLLSAVSSEVVKIGDDNSGWAMTKTFTALPNYANLTHIVLGCNDITDLLFHGGMTALQSLKFPDLVNVYHQRADRNNPIGIFDNYPALTELDCPKLETAGSGSYGSLFSQMPLLTKLTLPSFKEWRGTYAGGVVWNMAALTELDCPKLEKVTGGYASKFFAGDCPLLAKVRVGYGVFTGNSPFYNCPNLIDFEYINEVTASQNLSQWNPTNVLADADKTATFLQNFKEHIALRLTANGSGKTLTLSQAVRDAIHAAEATYGIEAIIVTQKGWTLSPAPTA